MKDPMQQSAITLALECAQDWWEVEALYDLCFAPGRSALSSYRLREGVDPIPELCLTARDNDGILAGAVRNWPVRVGGAVLTWGAILMVALVLALAYVLRHTAWGRHVFYAVGDDPEAAGLSGVCVTRVLISVYTISGLIERLGSVSPTSGQLENINSITAVVMGGSRSSAVAARSSA